MTTTIQPVKSQTPVRRETKEVRRLKKEALDGLILSVDIFNRPFDRGRYPAVLIHLDHSLEMLLKAILSLHRKRLFEPKSQVTIGFNRCVNLCLSSLDKPALTEQEAKALRRLHAVRSDAQHYFLEEENEGFLYQLIRLATRAFASVWQHTFETSIEEHLPDRVIPLATRPNMDIDALFLHDVARMRDAFQGGAAKKAWGRRIMRKWGLIYAADKIEEINSPIVDHQFDWFESIVHSDAGIVEVLPMLGGSTLDEHDVADRIAIHLTKREGIAIHLVDDNNENGQPLMAVREYSEFDRFPFRASDLAKRISEEFPKFNIYDVQVANAYLNLKANPKMYIELPNGNQILQRYSLDAERRIRELYRQKEWSELREWFRAFQREQKARSSTSKKTGSS